MIETCPDVSLEILKGIGVMGLSMLAFVALVWAADIIRKALSDIAHYIDRG